MDLDDSSTARRQIWILRSLEASSAFAVRELISKGARNSRRHAACTAHSVRFTHATATLLFLLSSASAGAQAAPSTNPGLLPTASSVLVAQAASPDVTFWESVRDSEDPAEIEAYLKAYPNGEFAPLARIRLDKLKRAPKEAAPAASPEPPRAEGAKAPPVGEGRHTVSVKIGESAGSKRGVLGVRIAPITPGVAKSLGLESASGAWVVETLANTGAQLAGIKPLDLIVEFDGRPVPKFSKLPLMVGATPPGTEARLTLLRIAPSFSELASRLRARAEKGDIDAAYGLGWLYAGAEEASKNLEESARWYRKAADGGNAEAMMRLGWMYADGLGVPKDESQAITLFRKAAEKNDPDAIANLGTMHKDGRGVAKDPAEAARWYRKAAELGQTNAMYQLGLLNASGLGVPQDDAEAVIWFRRATDEDHPDATANLAFMYERGRGVFNDDAQAVRLYQKAAELNHLGAMNQLGSMYADGRGTAKDDATAVAWYRRAADLGHADAIASLGWMYQMGRGVAQDDAEAIRLYRKAADLGNPYASHNLGIMYLNGRGVAKDEPEALRWFRKAADVGSVNALYQLGRSYQDGLGVKRDPSAAADWIFKAIKAHDAYTVKEMTTNAQAWSKEFRRELQQRLKEAGVYDGKVDGKFGDSTKTAIEALAQQQ